MNALISIARGQEADPRVAIVRRPSCRRRVHF
jgi:hypothetical protein